MPKFYVKIIKNDIVCIPSFIFIVANEVSDLIFKTIHFHHYTQGESFICTGGGAGRRWAFFKWGKFWEQILLRRTPSRRKEIFKKQLCHL